MMISSRRGCFGLMACACFATDASLAAGAEALPAGYTAPTHKPEPGKAPHMQARIVSGAGSSSRVWAVIFREGDEIMSGLSDWMAREKIHGAHLTAIGAFSSALFGWFDKDKKAYRDIPIVEQVECIGLIGDIGLVEGKPALHVHGSVGLQDGSVKGGHLLRAVASPTLEVFVTESTIPLHKTQDKATTLELFNLTL